MDAGARTVAGPLSSFWVRRCTLSGSGQRAKYGKLHLTSRSEHLRRSFHLSAGRLQNKLFLFSVDE